MVKEKNSPSDDPEVARLQKKAKEGALNVVMPILNDPRVQKAINKSVLRQTFSSGLVMACLFVGLLKLYEIAKTYFCFSLLSELLISVMLIVVGLIYMVKNIFFGSKSGDGTTSRGDS